MTGEGRWSDLGFAEWKGRVGAQIETFGAQVAELFAQIKDINKEIGNIKAKSAAIGATVAIIMNLVFMMIQYFKVKGD